MRHFSVITEELSTGLNQWTGLFNLPPNICGLYNVLLSSCIMAQLIFLLSFIILCFISLREHEVFLSELLLLASRGRHHLHHYLPLGLHQSQGPLGGLSKHLRGLLNDLKLFKLLKHTIKIFSPSITKVISVFFYAHTVLDISKITK